MIYILNKKSMILFISVSLSIRHMASKWRGVALTSVSDPPGLFFWNHFHFSPFLNLLLLSFLCCYQPSFLSLQRSEEEGSAPWGALSQLNSWLLCRDIYKVVINPRQSLKLSLIFSSFSRTLACLAHGHKLADVKKKKMLKTILKSLIKVVSFTYKAVDFVVKCMIV